MGISKRVLYLMAVSFLFFLSQTPDSFAQDDDFFIDGGDDVTFQGESSEDIIDSEETEVIPSDEDVESGEEADDNIINELPEIEEPELETISATLGRASANATSDIYTNPQAVIVSQVGVAQFIIITTSNNRLI